jgi:hypothetical protein
MDRAVDGLKSARGESGVSILLANYILRVKRKLEAYATETVRPILSFEEAPDPSF